MSQQTQLKGSKVYGTVEETAVTKRYNINSTYSFGCTRGHVRNKSPEVSVETTLPVVSGGAPCEGPVRRRLPTGVGPIPRSRSSTRRHQGRSERSIV
jgi:hypothetical protein